ncbi:hypothetical protein H2201_004528 [Coniosporium apollinis]|uniref:Uncharacterized protein n=1 Tax=Coniosporium apollinis TaxID=61459 RepID=A0ABQ9NSS5_9PEZI|nr:hypothetical protein H2201_004528 [Coniosporium apollinis]
MFGLQEAKRIRRAELYSRQSSPRSSPDPALTELLRSRVQQDFDTIEHPIQVQNNGENCEQSEDELEFRLFAAPPTVATSGLQRIRLRSPPVDNAEASFVQLHRPPSYYFTGELSQAELELLESVAVSGDDVIKRSRSPWPGSTYAWKVTVVSATGKVRRNTAEEVQPDKAVSKRKRIGKKHRIALRKKAQAEAEKKAAATRTAAEREATEREKRTRRNRGKKVKKKEKEKAKKTAAKIGDVPVGTQTGLAADSP